jgi:hypothetical protein
MNTIANTVQCINGLCGHPEHIGNSLWWSVPIIIIGAYIIKVRHGKA